MLKNLIKKLSPKRDKYKYTKLKFKELEPVEGIVVFCEAADAYTMCFRKKGTPINFKCPLCGSYVPNGEHRGCVLVS